ncbi:hypothetical protein L1987_46798 [Smallanthus sonchifolius]|uniref:Uncharacterized protein n=1 Tax=Smallanthus sonchifolius TaxID=185202 RepID=A0ACB9G1Q9_9ASTR|nr:hypothetical protein L1987_46798 [Smallanthus sonchifolius]
MIITPMWRKKGNIGDCREENRLVAEEIGNVMTDDVVVNLDPVSPEICLVIVMDLEASPSEYLERTSILDQISIDSRNRRFLGKKKSGGGSGGSGERVRPWGGEKHADMEDRESMSTCSKSMHNEMRL